MTVRAAIERWVDPALALALAVCGALEVAADPRAVLPAAVVAAAATGLVLVGRRRLPLLDGVAVLAGMQVLISFAPRFQAESVFGPAVILISLYSVGRHARGVEAWLAGPLVVAVVVLSVADDFGPNAGNVVFFVVFCGLPWGTGLAVRLRALRVRALREQADAALERTRRAVADERVRIARELHDVVAHAIAVTVLQARGSRKLVGRDDDAVAASLDAVEQANAAALADMQRLLAVLRGTDPDTEPPDLLAGIDAVVGQVRGAGVVVDIRIAAPLPELPPLVDRTAHRVVQESLTNVLKHGGRGASARVVVEADARSLRIEVTSTRTGSPAPGGGHGLAGLRERVEAQAGTLFAGPEPGAWIVRVELPAARPAVLQ